MRKLFSVSALLLSVSLPARAAPVDGDTIRKALIGNTVQGEMMLSGKYAEFYDKDGNIQAADYGGTWRIRDDKMCFKYGEEPATCYQVEIKGSEVTWLKDDQIDGTGTIVLGNPNKF